METKACAHEGYVNAPEIRYLIFVSHSYHSSTVRFQQTREWCSELVLFTDFGAWLDGDSSANREEISIGNDGFIHYFL